MLLNKCRLQHSFSTSQYPFLLDACKVNTDKKFLFFLVSTSMFSIKNTFVLMKIESEKNKEFSQSKELKA